jgi:hypothetical protein
VTGSGFAVEENHVGLHALSVEEAGRKPEDGVHVALVHELSAHGLARVGGVGVEVQRSPLLTTVSTVQTTVGPPYAEVPIPLFWDSFEAGDTSAWSAVLP